MTKLRIVYMGTPDFAAIPLQALHGSGVDITAVYCQPPRPAGRGHHLQKCGVQETAEQLGIPVFTPVTLKTIAAQQAFGAHQADIAIIAAYGLLLPKAVLNAPRLGCVNIHVSLLPRWRGAAPVPRAILAGDTDSGTTIMQMDEGMDTGPILQQEKLAIAPTATSASLLNDLFELGARMIVPLLPKLATGEVKAVPQPATGITHAAKLTKQDGLVDWTRTAGQIERMVRALTPWPGVAASFNGEPLKILSCEIINGSGTAGVILDDQCTIACGEKALRLVKVQRAGRGPVSGADFMRGARLHIGATLQNGILS